MTIEDHIKFDSTYLKTLLIRYSNITTISDSFFHTNRFHSKISIEKLHNNNVHLEKVQPSAFSNLNNLHDLNIAYNSISKLYIGTFH